MAKLQRNNDDNEMQSNAGRQRTEWHSWHVTHIHQPQQKHQADYSPYTGWTFKKYPLPCDFCWYFSNACRFFLREILHKMLSYRRETALQGALQFSPKVEDWNWETILYEHYRSIVNHCDGWGANIGWKSAISLQRGPIDPKFQVEGTTHQPFFFSEN